MNDDSTNLNNVNKIAYDPNLRVNLKTIHEMLGLEITDVATKAMEFGFKFNIDTEKVLKYLSKMASQLSIALISARKTKEQLSPEEQKDYDSIKNIAAVLGNLQYKLNEVIKVSIEIGKMNEKLNTQGMELAEYIIQAQEQFRNIRSSINAYGFLSKNPELSYIFEEQNGAAQ